MLPELLTEGDTLEQAQSHVRDAFEAAGELLAEAGRPLPASIHLPAAGEVGWCATMVGSSCTTGERPGKCLASAWTKLCPTQHRHVPDEDKGEAAVAGGRAPPRP